MYHKPRMCRTCLQMSRGDFKFVSLDSVDPLWESNSPNLKAQLIYLVPEMKIDSSGSYICTSCFIALRTAYEFKRMCQSTEQKFQNHNYKYRRPYGVGPGSSQFHVTLNENCNKLENPKTRNLNYLQADTSIDITEHHLYDATKIAPRKQLTYINNVTQKLPEIDLEVISKEKIANKLKDATNEPKKVEVTAKVENNPNKVENNVSKVETDVNKMEGNSNKVENNSNTVENNSNKVENNSNKVESNSNKVESNSNKVENNSNKEENNSNKMENNSNNVENNSNNVENSSKVEDNPIKLENNSIKLENNSVKMEDNSNKIESNSNTVENNPDKVEKKEDLPDNNEDISEIISKKLDSVELRKKYNIGSQISILKTQPKAVLNAQAIIKMACEEIPDLKLNAIEPDALSCHVRLQLLTQDFVKDTSTKYTLDELKEIANSYFENSDLLLCKFCSRSFSTPYWLQIHEEEHANDKPFGCTHCNTQFLRSESLEEHLKIHNKLSLLTPNSCDGSHPQITKPPDPDAVESTSDGIKEEKPLNSTDNPALPINKEDIKLESSSCDQGKSDSTEASITIKPEVLNENKPIGTIIEEKSEPMSCDIKGIGEDAKIVEVPNPSAATSTPINKKVEDEAKPSNTLEKIKYRKKYHQKLVRYYKCLICNKICRGEIQLHQHCKFVHVPNILSSNYWSNYISTIQLDEKIIENLEEYETKEESLLMQTRSVSYKNVLNPYKCNICGKSFAEENFLNIHMYVHTPTILSPENVFTSNYESPDVYTCYLCNKGFAKERYLKLHNLHVHLSKTTVCKICRREFKSDFWFSRHRCQQPVEVPVVEEGKAYPCNFCNRKFARLRFMKSHRKRMHKDFIRSPVRIKPKYLPSRNNKEPFEMGDLEMEVDPMNLYTIAGSASFEDDEDIIEILSDSEEYTDESSNESHGDDEDDNTTVFIPTKNESQYKAIDNRKTFETLNTNILKLGEVEEIKFGNSSEITIRRKSVVRSPPKIQCDFCGEFIDESAYDNHIYEHNNIRLQKSLTGRKIEHNYSFDPMQDGSLDHEKIVLKCHICFKAFKRRFYLISHINKHLRGEDTKGNEGEIIHSEGEEVEKYINDNEQSQKEVEVDETDYGRVVIINGMEIYECCGRSFKLKAHFFRHFKIKHPNSVYRPKSPEFRSGNENDAEKGNTGLQTNSGVGHNAEPQAIMEIQNESINEDEGNCSVSQLSFNEAIQIEHEEEENLNFKEEEENLNFINNKNISKHGIPFARKLIGLNETTMEQQKMMKRELSDVEDMIKRKRTKTDVDEMLVRSDLITTPIHFSDIEFLPLGAKPSPKYECNVCEKKFKQKCQLRDHYNVHTGDKPYKCDFCNPVRGFTQTSSLYVHFRRVHAVIMKNCLWEVYSKNGECLVCSTIFEKHAFMFQHMKDHYVEKEFQCHLCMKQFNMTCHYRIHNIDPLDMQEMLLPQDSLEIVLTVDTEDEKEKPLSEPEVLQCLDERSDTPASSVTEGTCDSDTTSSNNDGNEDNKNVNPEQLKCAKCDKTFTDQQQLRFHKKSLAHFQQVQTMKKQNSPNEDNANANATVSDQTDTIEDIQNSVDAIMKKIRTIKRHHCPKCEMSFVKKIHLKKHKKKCHRLHPLTFKQTAATATKKETATSNSSESMETSTIFVETEENLKLLEPTCEINETEENLKLLEPTCEINETEENLKLLEPTCEINETEENLKLLEPTCEINENVETTGDVHDTDKNIESSEISSEVSENVELVKITDAKKKLEQLEINENPMSTECTSVSSKDNDIKLSDDESQIQCTLAASGSKLENSQTDSDMKQLHKAEDESSIDGGSISNNSQETNSADSNQNSIETKHEIADGKSILESEEQLLESSSNSVTLLEKPTAAMDVCTASNNSTPSKTTDSTDKLESQLCQTSSFDSLNPDIECTNTPASDIKLIDTKSSTNVGSPNTNSHHEISSTTENVVTLNPNLECLENSAVNTASKIQENIISSDSNLDCLQSNFGTDAESPEQDALSMNTNINFDCVENTPFADKMDVDGPSDSNNKCLESTGLNEDSVENQPKAASSDQNVDCPRSIYSLDNESLKTEFTVSSTDCNVDYPKSIPNEECLETNNMETTKNFDCSL